MYYEHFNMKPVYWYDIIKPVYWYYDDIIKIVVLYLRIYMYYYTSVYIFYIELNADKITILHIKIQLLILFK